MKALFEQLDLKASRKAAREHLKCLGKKVMHQEIMEYIHYTNSVISGVQHIQSNEDKTLQALEKQREDNLSVSYYIKMVVGKLNIMEEEERKVLLGKYLYQWDDEEMEKYMKKSIFSIKNLIREAELDFAILMHCEKFKQEDKKHD